MEESNAGKCITQRNIRVRIAKPRSEVILDPHKLTDVMTASYRRI